MKELINNLCLAEKEIDSLIKENNFDGLNSLINNIYYSKGYSSKEEFSIPNDILNRTISTADLLSSVFSLSTKNDEFLKSFIEDKPLMFEEESKESILNTPFIDLIDKF